MTGKGHEDGARGRDDRRARLEAWLAEAGSVAVMFSGGVDSAFLLAVAVKVLGARAVTVTGRSSIHPAREHGEALSLAAALGARHRTMDTAELADPSFSSNPPDRCAVCKTAIVEAVTAVARQEGLALVLDGSNADDAGDYRPGMEAARRLGVRSPLMELGLTKKDIRELSREMGLPTWDKPSLACLASRIPYGEEITTARLARVERAEDSLRDMGLAHVRVRDHGDVARVEVAPELIAALAAPARRAEVAAALRKAGYRYVCLDLEGYRTGSMNEALAEAVRGGGG